MRGDPYAELAAVPAFQVSSEVVADGVTMPVAQRSGIFDAGGQDVSPDLTWSGFPDATRSFIVTMYDPDAPTPSGFWHWTVVDLPSDSTSLPQRAGASDAELSALIRHAVAGKQAGHGIDTVSFVQPARPMSAIGG